MKPSKGWRLLGSIKWRVFTACAVLVAVVLGVLWVFQTGLLNTFYRSIKVKQLQSCMQQIIKNIDDPELDSLLEEISAEKQLCIVITDETGFVLHSQKEMRDCLIHRMDALTYVSAYYLTLKNGGAYFEQTQQLWENDKAETAAEPAQTGDGTKLLLYMAVTAQADGSPRFILLNTKMFPVTAAVETLQVQLTWITAIMLVLAFLMALLLSYMVSKPIRRINESAKQLAAGNYQVTFSEGGYREVQELAQTLNYAARELSKVDGLQRELVANVSHDLRTPLTMIVGYAEVIRDLPNENTPENIQVIIDEATRLSDLVSDVLDLSKLQSGAETLQVEVFNLTESIRSLLKRYGKMTDYSITFQAETDAWVKGDPLKMTQVVCNLVNNAINYTGPDKRVALRQTTAANRVRVEITDTGAGIEPSKLNDIWERYYKVDKTHKRAQVGTGLGLSIVKSILDLHPGTTYGVMSELGKGSCFWFEMERQDPPLPEGKE